VPFILITLFLDVLGVGLIIPILPKLIEELSGGNVPAASATFGALAALYSAMQFLFSPVLGSLSDRFGRRPVILFSLLAISIGSMTGYGLATQGWMIYAILAVGSLGMISGPAAQGLISRQVPLNEQGAVQGALGSLASLSGIVGPPLGAGLFGFFISERAPIYLPGAGFFCSAFLMVMAWLLARRAFRLHPEPPPGAMSPTSKGVSS
ncbi:MAG: MFS transporter, partial [Limisphaerales bacterium]